MSTLVFILLISVFASTFSLRSMQYLPLLRRSETSHIPLYVSTRKGISLSTQKLVEDTTSIIYQPEPISSSDTVLYGVLASIQLLPPLALIDLPEPLDAIRRPVSYLYFIVSATILVILGAKRQDIKQGPQQKPISLKSAALAPIVSSVLIFTIYLLLKYTDIEIYFDRVYQFLGDHIASNNQNHTAVNAHLYRFLLIFLQAPHWEFCLLTPCFPQLANRYFLNGYRRIKFSQEHHLMRMAHHWYHLRSCNL